VSLPPPAAHRRLIAGLLADKIGGNGQALLKGGVETDAAAGGVTLKPDLVMADTVA